MELWRISNYADLSGGGGLQAAGRWHTRGKRIVYLADHPASAVLEMLVHRPVRPLVAVRHEFERPDVEVRGLRPVEDDSLFIGRQSDVEVQAVGAG